MGLGGGSPFLDGGAFSAATSSAVVTHTWSPRMTGDDQPLPWISVFQRTLSFSLQVVTRLRASPRPSAVGPRNPGQESPPSARTTGRIKAARLGKPVRIERVYGGRRS